MAIIGEDLVTERKRKKNMKRKKERERESVPLHGLNKNITADSKKITTEDDKDSVPVFISKELEADRKKMKRERVPLYGLNKNIMRKLAADRKKITTNGDEDSAPVFIGKELEARKQEWISSPYNRSWQQPPWMSKFGAGMDDLSQWPPKWKDRVEESPEYEVLAPFLLDYKKKAKNPFCERYRILLEQIQNSRGYDITISTGGFVVMDLEGSVPNGVCKYVTYEINQRAKFHGEYYVFDEVKKIVRRKFPNKEYFCTFTVKKEEPTCDNIKTVQAYLHCQAHLKMLVYLKEWRFKP